MRTPFAPSVLVVEDEGLVAMHLKVCLTDLGLNAHVFTEGRPAMEAIDASDFTAAVLDLRLPDVAGEEIIRKLLARDPRFRIVVTTGEEVQDVQREFTHAPRVRVLSKPYDAGMLEEELVKLGVVQRMPRPVTRIFEREFEDVLLIA